MLISLIRFILKGWVYDLYIAPKYYFTFYGFEWVKPLGGPGMYFLFGVLIVTALFILIGLYYRACSAIFFLCFTYIELIDKTNYLNHYYSISIIGFLLIFVPAHRYFSLDIIRKPSIKATHVPRWTIWIFKLQLGIVYFYAGLAKLNYDWLIRAMPLRIWLPANAHLPIVGSLLEKVWVAYFFSWFGAIYDLAIAFLLTIRKTRLAAYVCVVLFHLATAILFQIGMFPYIMILFTLIFFSEDIHKRTLKKLQRLFPPVFNKTISSEGFLPYTLSASKAKMAGSLLVLHFLIQFMFPFRYIAYPKKLFWTEQGYRFSWRVMLMEKAGITFFYVEDPETGRKGEVMNSDYLTKNQEKMMATQPDMILQFAHFLEEEYKKKGIKDPVITVESYATLNGSGSRPFIDKTVDLTEEEESFLPKKWILPFNSKQVYED